MAASRARAPLTGEPRVVTSGFQARVYALVKKVPRGAVSTYGDVAGALGSRRVARQVGFALSALDKSRVRDVPWQRIINAQGAISFKGDLARAELQRALLVAEGIRFNEAGTVVDFDLHRHAFRAPRSRRPR